LRAKGRVFGAAKGKGCKERLFWILEWIVRIGSKLGRRQGLDCFVVHKSLKNIPKLSKGIQVRGARTCYFCVLSLIAL